MVETVPSLPIDLAQLGTLSAQSGASKVIPCYVRPFSCPSACTKAIPLPSRSPRISLPIPGAKIQGSRRPRRPIHTLAQAEGLSWAPGATAPPLAPGFAA
jgi:hypothetical protein